MDRSQASGRRLLAMVLILANLVAVAAIVWTGAAADAAIGIGTRTAENGWANTPYYYPPR